MQPVLGIVYYGLTGKVRRISATWDAGLATSTDLVVRGVEKTSSFWNGAMCAYDC